MSKEAKLYLRTLLDYAEGAEGFQERLGVAFGADSTNEAEFDAWCKKMGDLSSEIWAFLKD